MCLDEGFMFCSQVPIALTPTAGIRRSDPGCCVQPREVIRGVELYKPEMSSMWVSLWNTGSRSAGLHVRFRICPLGSRCQAVSCS